MPAPPEIHGEHQPRTVDRVGRIELKWTNPTKADVYHLMWREDQNAWSSVDIETGAPDVGFGNVDSPGYSGSFTISPAVPDRTYEFKVQGCITHTIGKDDCSEFSTGSIWFPPNTHGLLRFARDTLNARNSYLRGPISIKSFGASAYGAGLRAMMGI